MKSILSILCALMTCASVSAKMKVAALHPLLADLAVQIGGDDVVVVNLLAGNADPHTFQPTPKVLAAAQGSALYLAMGKNLEPFLPKLKSIIGSQSIVMEVGRNIPSLRIDGDSSIYACCPKHASGTIDPHWWHSVENWRRASNDLAIQFGKLDPANKADYAARASQYRKTLSALLVANKKQIASIPRNRRILATAHAAFGYFCKEYGFKAVPVQGLNKEQSASTQYIAEAIATIKKHHVAAIFPEKLANRKGVETIAKNAGINIGDPLYADTCPSIIGLFQHNVSAITKALK